MVSKGYVGDRSQKRQSNLTLFYHNRLDEYLPDLAKRAAFFRQWVEAGRTPHNFWISGLFFPQACSLDSHIANDRSCSLPFDGEGGIAAPKNIPGGVGGIFSPFFFIYAARQ